MREFTVAEATRTTGTIPDALAALVREHPRAVLFARSGGDLAAGWEDITAEQFLGEVRRLAAGLVAAGVEPGAHVGIMSATRYEWTLWDFAIWEAGAVPVPVYETSSPDQAQWILGDSGAVAIAVETADNRACIESLRDRLPSLRHIWDIADVAAVSAPGAEVDAEQLARARQGQGSTSRATLIYTSGTTGRPKGCELSHGNFVDLTLAAQEGLSDVFRPDGSTLLFLPLAHVFARFVEVACLLNRSKVAHLSDTTKLADTMGAFRPTFILAVPRVFEKVYNAAEQTAESGGRGNIFRRAAAVAVDWSRAQDHGGPGLLLRVQHAVFDRLVYRKLRDRMGGRLEFAVSGGGPLGERLGHFFRGVGITILEGYGLTETTAPATVNAPSHLKIGTVGKPLPGVGIRIAEDGEILIKGVNVMQAYHGNPEATAEALQDGWFRTGDIGSLDDEGFLRITGRKKEIIVTAGGKNVVPSELEDRLRAHPLISQAMVVGDNRPFVGALVTLDAEMLPTWLTNHHLPEMSPEQAATDGRVREAVQAAVDAANKAVSRAESIREFRILERDFTIDEGHLTPSLKMRRSDIGKEFASEIDAIYTR